MSIYVLLKQEIPAMRGAFFSEVAWCTAEKSVVVHSFIAANNRVKLQEANSTHQRKGSEDVPTAAGGLKFERTWYLVNICVTFCPSSFAPWCSPPSGMPQFPTTLIYLIWMQISVAANCTATCLRLQNEVRIILLEALMLTRQICLSRISPIIKTSEVYMAMWLAVSHSSGGLGCSASKLQACSCLQLALWFRLKCGGVSLTYNEFNE